jgi:hypothetical protein
MVIAVFLGARAGEVNGTTGAYWRKRGLGGIA